MSLYLIIKSLWVCVVITDLAGNIKIGWVKKAVFVSGKVIGSYLEPDRMVYILKKLSTLKSAYVFSKYIPMKGIQENSMMEPVIPSVGDYWELMNASLGENAKFTFGNPIHICLPPYVSSILVFYALRKFFLYMGGKFDINEISESPFINKGIEDLKDLNFVSDEKVITYSHWVIVFLNDNPFVYFVIVLIVIFIIILCRRVFTANNISSFLTGFNKFLTEKKDKGNKK